MRLVVAAVAAVLVAGCAGPSSGVPAVPPLPAETLPLPPVSDAPMVWRPGDWVFSGGSYRYEQGGYVPAAGHGGSWLFGHWEGDRGRYVWVPGRWV